MASPTDPSTIRSVAALHPQREVLDPRYLTLPDGISPFITDRATFDAVALHPPK